MRRLAPLALLPLLALPAAAEPRDLAAVHYDLLLAEHCALLDPAVVAGYRAEYRDLVARDALDEAAQVKAEGRANLAFEREWSNRGLGGSRPWCRTEGVASAARLAGYPGAAPRQQ